MTDDPPSPRHALDSGPNWVTMDSSRRPNGGVAWIFRRMAPRGSRGVLASIEGAAASMQDTVRVGLIGSGFITAIHHEALRRVAGAEVVAVASPGPGRAERFAAERGIPRHFTDYRALLDLREVDLVVLGLPNDLHCEATCLAAAGGEARRRREADGPQPGRVRPDDRRLRACRSHARLRRGAVLHAQVRPAQGTGRRGGPGQGPPGQAVREARRPPRRLVLRHPAQRRGRDLRHGLPRDRVLPMDPRRPGQRGQGADPERLRPDGHLCPRRQDRRRRRGDPARDIRRRRRSAWPRRAGPSPAGWTTGPRSSAARARPTPTSSTATPCARIPGAAMAMPSRRPARRPGWSFPIYEEIWNYGFPQEMEHFVACVRDGHPAARGRPGWPRRRRGHPCPLCLGRSRLPRRCPVRERCGPADRPLEAGRPSRRRLTPHFASLSQRRNARSNAATASLYRSLSSSYKAPVSSGSRRTSSATWSRAPTIWK